MAYLLSIVTGGEYDLNTPFTNPSIKHVFPTAKSPKGM